MVSSPSPPDPYEQADAQAGANIDSAIATDLLNNRTEITPTGTVQYVDSGTRTIVDSQGNTRQIPTRDRIITLSDDQQEILDLTEETSKNLMGTAVERSDFLSGYLADGLDTSSMTPWAGPVDSPTLDTSRVPYETLQTYGGPAGELQYSYEANTVDQPADLINFVPQTGVDLNNDFSTFGSGIRISSGGGASGRVGGAGEGIQKSVDLDKSGGTIGNIKQGYSSQTIDGSIADAGPIQDAVNYDGPGIRYETTMSAYDTPLEDAGDIRYDVGDQDHTARLDAVQDAIMSRYDRQFAQIEDGLDAKLRAQGLVPGSEAYDTQFRQAREQYNDATMQAILAAGQEDSRLFGIDLASAQFANQAQGQEFDQSIRKGLFGLDVNQANNQTSLLGDQFYNQSVGQGFDQALQEGSFFNAAQGQQFGQNREQTLTNMDATERNNARQEDLARFYNEGQNQRFQQTLANAGFANDAELAMGTFANNAQAQGFDQRATETQLGIQAAGVNASAAASANANKIALERLALDAQVAANNSLLQEAGFNNNAALTTADFFNDATTQGLTNDLAATGFNNQTAADLAAFNNATYGADLTGGLAMAGYNSGVTQQNNQNLATQQAQQNAYIAQQYGMDQSAANYQNQLRQNELQEAAYLRGLPISEINSLMSGSQLLMPSFTSPMQTGVAPVPIAQYQQDAYEAQLANSSATAQGLLGLGGSLLSAFTLGSDRRIKKNIRKVGKLRNGVNVYRYNLRHNDQPQVGVMADEVRHIPGAVETIGGIDHVHYDRVLNHG